MTRTYPITARSENGGRETQTKELGGLEAGSGVQLTATRNKNTAQYGNTAERTKKLALKVREGKIFKCIF